MWAHYNFYVDGKHTHCGIESFQLYKQEGKWRIADTHIWDADNKGPGDKCGP